MRFSMRLLLALALLALTAAVPVGAQEDVREAVQWNWQLVPADAKPGSEAELVLVARLAPKWIVYSSDFKSGLGPLPARLKRPANSQLELIEPLRSIGARRKKDPSFDGEYGYFSERAELRQRVRLPQDGSRLQATLNGQACYEADGTCHLFRQDITIAAR
jgi:thiol:disulfide interchange protein DsbD